MRGALGGCIIALGLLLPSFGHSQTETDGALAAAIAHIRAFHNHAHALRVTALKLYNLPSGELKLWDVAVARKVRDLAGHTLGINSLAFSADSRALVSAGADSTVRFSEAATGQALATPAQRTGDFYSLATSPTEALLATAASDSTVQLINLKDGALLHTFTGHAQAVYCAAFSRDGQRLATGGADKMALVYDVARRQLIAAFPHPSEVVVVAFSPDGSTLACGGDDKVTLWDLRSRHEIGTIRGVRKAASSLNFTPDGATLATSGEVQLTQLWDVRAFTASEQIRALGALGVGALAVSPDGRHLAVSVGGAFVPPDLQSDIQVFELPSSRTQRAHGPCRWRLVARLQWRWPVADLGGR